MKYLQAFLEMASPPSSSTHKQCYPAELYDRQIARRHAYRDKTLTPEQRTNLVLYAEEAEKTGNNRST